jgi:S-DNA-T family DNA segregation ATPase FtsK/SpoIIIE
VVKIREKQFIFEVVLKGATRKRHLYDCLDDVRRVLELPLLQIHEADPKIFIVASEHRATGNDVPDILKSPEFLKAKRQLEIPYAVGRDATGKMIIVDLRELPHLIIGGSTKMGKTVALWCQLLSVISGCSPDNVRLLIYDGASNLTMFKGFPHLLGSVIQDPAIGFEVIINLEREMEQRLVRKESVDFRFHPSLVCVIDEFSSLVDGITDKAELKQFATAISRLARSGRQADIHLVMAIHSPTKANTGGCDLNSITARMAFKCSTTAQSVALINNDNAKTLVRKGEMLFRLSEDEQLHLQGAFISPNELEQVLNHARSYWNKKTPQNHLKEFPSIIAASQADIKTRSVKVVFQESLFSAICTRRICCHASGKCHSVCVAIIIFGDCIK